MSCEKWVWVELLAFDNASPDYGVRGYIDNAGFVPGVVSFLMSSADFVHFDEPVKIMTVTLKEGKLRLLIGNDQWSYAHPQIELGNGIRSIKVVTRFPYQAITPTSHITDDTRVAIHQTQPPTGSNFMVRIPPKGIVVLDITQNERRSAEGVL